MSMHMYVQAVDVEICCKQEEEKGVYMCRVRVSVGGRDIEIKAGGYKEEKGSGVDGKSNKDYNNIHRKKEEGKGV